jgi:hypothetical protein
LKCLVAGRLLQKSVVVFILYPEILCMLTSFLMDAMVWRRLVWLFEKDILILGVVGEVVEVGLELLLGCEKVGSWVE